VEERSGQLANGCDYLIRVPAGWDGVLINDLDFLTVQGRRPRLIEFLLQRGYALSGTTRSSHGKRQRDDHHVGNFVDRIDDHVLDQLGVLDAFREAFGAPSHAVQMGISLGGLIGLTMGERHPDRIDGVIAISGPYSLVAAANMRLDLMFALKQLLEPASDLPVLPDPANALHQALEGRDRATSRGRDIIAKALDPWLGTLAGAQRTAAGRARIALALTVAQFPAWGAFWPTSIPRPDWIFREVNAAQGAMYQCAVEGLLFGLGQQGSTRPLFPCWNNDVDYEQFYENAASAQREVVDELYRIAGSNTRDIGADLRRINDGHRITADAAEVAVWGERALTGALRTPILHVSTIGDVATPPALMDGYEQQVKAAGTAALYRQAFVERANHGELVASESIALVETMVRRLEREDWSDSTEPDCLNELGNRYAVDEPAFIDYHLPHLNRAFPAA
jgi:pimeloyl-ACP methyl ester carboxylesterase